MSSNPDLFMGWFIHFFARKRSRKWCVTESGKSMSLLCVDRWCQVIYSHAKKPNADFFSPVDDHLPCVVACAQQLHTTIGDTMSLESFNLIYNTSEQTQFCGQHTKRKKRQRNMFRYQVWKLIIFVLTCVYACLQPNKCKMRIAECESRLLYLFFLCVFSMTDEK